MFGMSGLIIDLNDRKASRRVRNQIYVTNCKHEADHKGKLHDAVQSDSRNHAMGDSRPWSFDFITCASVSILYD
jgi:hypothetical protein